MRATRRACISAPPRATSGQARAKAPAGAASRATYQKSIRSRRRSPEAAQMNVLIPSQLRDYTGGRAHVEARGATLAELLADLERRFPGIRFRMIDEQDAIRRHIKIFVNQEQARDLGAALAANDEVTIVGALSGG